MTNYALVLERRHPGRQWSINDNDYDTLVIHDDGSKPSKKSLDDAWPSVLAEIELDNQTKFAAAQSARAKLAALGLTEAEIKALVG
jgi:hypothetical protein